MCTLSFIWHLHFIGSLQIFWSLLVIWFHLLLCLQSFNWPCQMHSFQQSSSPFLTSFTSGVSLDPTLSFEPSRPLVQSVLMGSLPRNFGVYLFKHSQTRFDSSLGVLPLDNYSLDIPPMDCSQLECPPWLHLCTQFR